MVMVNQKAIDYVKTEIQKGVDKVQIENSLLSNGWQKTDIDQLFLSVDNFIQ
jgi:uncharacterized protein Smg (DUF494 family)